MARRVHIGKGIARAFPLGLVFSPKTPILGQKQADLGKSHDARTNGRAWAIPAAVLNSGLPGAAMAEAEDRHRQGRADALAPALPTCLVKYLYSCDYKHSPVLTDGHVWKKVHLKMPSARSPCITYMLCIYGVSASPMLLAECHPLRGRASRDGSMSGGSCSTSTAG